MFGDQQMRYPRYVRPVILDGIRCAVVAPAPVAVEPREYRFLLDFAQDNEFVVIDPGMPASGDHCPVPGNALDRLLHWGAKKKTANFDAPVTRARLAVCRRRATRIAL